MKAETSDTSVQDDFITNLIENNEPVSIYLKSGVQLKGIIVGFDKLTITLSYHDNLQLVYKHAIATIYPQAKEPS